MHWCEVSILNKRGILVFSLLSVILLSSAVTVSYALTPSNIYSPNGVKYKVVFMLDGHLVNESQGNVVYDQHMDVRFNLTLVSKRLSLDYIGWGFIIELPPSIGLNFNGENYSRIPIPPILAVKENTREIYFPSIVFRLLKNQDMNVGIADITQELYRLNLNTEFYLVNPFILDRDVSIGDSVKYGFVNKTSNNKLLLEGTVTGESDENLLGTNFKVFDVSVAVDSLLRVARSFRDFFNLNLDYGDGVLEILNITRLMVTLKYDTTSLWLMKSVLTVSLENSTMPENVTGYLNANLNVEMIDAGNLPIGGRGLLSRLIGIPDFGLLVIDVGLIVLVLFAVFWRVKK